MICGTPFSMAFDGYLLDKGRCGNAKSMAYAGYLIDIIREGDGRYEIRIGDEKGLRGGGGFAIPIAIEEEDDLILGIIALFLEHDRKGWL